MTTALLDRIIASPATTDLRAGRPPTLDEAARIVWSSVVEPGDRVAGLLAEAMGPSASLVAVDALGSAIRDVAVTEMVGIVRDAGNEISHDDVCDGVARWAARLKNANLVAQLEAAVRVGSQVVLPHDEDWPSGLADLGWHAPHALWLRGNRETLERMSSSVAIVGARASSGYGEHVTMELVSGLVRHGHLIVSGAAYGIDGMAHRAALAEDHDTVAILAGGIDRLYPSGHDALLNRIIASGCVITEMPPGFSPTKWRFLQRNRLIAAMTRATIVVEAGWRSGSLNTAHHAVALGRPLGVVPGPVTSASSAGCHRLLCEEPAVCVTNATEVAELLQVLTLASANNGPHRSERSLNLSSLSSVEQRVLDALGTRPKPATSLVVATGLSALDVEAGLGVLNALGVARETDTGWQRQK